MPQIGFIQFTPCFCDQEATIKKLAKILDTIEQPTLIVIPELANSGYNFDNYDQAASVAENTSSSKYLDFLSEMAVKRNHIIVSGFNEKDHDKLYNSSVIIGPDGLIGKYRKMHLFMNEKEIFTPGNELPEVYDIGFAKVGMLICFDWMFPELWRILAMKGADIICHPSNLVLPYAQQAVPVHGLINKTFCVTANRVGTEKNVTFTGGSIISDPMGKTLHQASGKEEETYCLNIDIMLARDKQITTKNHAYNDRKPTIYRTFEGY